MVTKSILDICKLLIILAFLTFQSYSKNNTEFGILSTDIGLSQNSIVRIFQDNHGFLWLGTLDGLNRYDGFKFKISTNIAGDSF